MHICCIIFFYLIKPFRSPQCLISLYIGNQCCLRNKPQSYWSRLHGCLSCVVYTVCDVYKTSWLYLHLSCEYTHIVYAVPPYTAFF